MQPSSEKGFTLIEVMIALAVLTVGVLGVAAVIAAGVQNLSSSPGDVIVTQKAAQAVEAVFAARDSHKLTWDQIRNISGEDGDTGIFIDGPTGLTLPGPDGLVNTADDLDEIESMVNPGRDRLLETDDDQIVVMSQYTREIAIEDVPDTNGQLRSIVVTITFQSGPTKRAYTLSTFISAYS